MIPGRPRVVILDDHITHYRIPLFSYLAGQSIQLTVLYCARNLSPNQLTLPSELGYDHRVLPGFVLRLTRPPYVEPRNVLLNPTLPWELARLGPAVVVGYSFSIPTWIAFAYARLFGKVFVSWSGDTLHTERLLGAGQRRARKMIIPRADACVGLSQAAKEKYVAFGAPADRVKVSVQASGYSRTARGLSGRAATREGDRLPATVLYVGSLTERKGVQYLLDSFASIHRQLPIARLIIVGDGPLKEQLKGRAAELRLDGAVTFAGFVQPQRLSEYYEQAGLFLFPTLEDTFGVVIAEAAAFGLPLVTSPYAGATSEFVQDRENGYVVEPTDTNAVAQAALRILTDPKLQAEMSRRSREIAASHTLEQAGGQFLEAIELSLNSGSWGKNAA